MRPAHFRQQWLESRDSRDTQTLTHLARHTALAFLDRYFYSDHFDEQYIDLLCEMSTGFEDAALNNIGAAALFGVVVEQLCDDFEELQTQTYNRLISQVVTYLRALPQCGALDQRLRQFGLYTRQHLYDRIESIRANSDQRRQLDVKPKKILLLSRVTIGADVAISSVFCQRLKHYFPDAQIVLFGSIKLQEIYAGNADVRIQALDYVRRGGLVERFNAWLTLSDLVDKELAGYQAGEVLMFDPDSRLSQLGVLPLIDSEQYFFFNSRGKDSYPKKISIAELANFWMEAVLGPGHFCYPGVWPDAAKISAANRLVDRLRGDGCRRLIAINFGVGGNPRKRLSDRFEQLLVLALLKQAANDNVTILFDMGFGEEELSVSEKILTSVREQGYAVVCCRFDELAQNRTRVDVLGIHCGIGDIASLISVSDEFIGYDSACQHISAALGRPTYTIFAGSNNVRFIRRWTACGPNVSEIVFVDTLSRNQNYDEQDIVERLLDRRGQE